MSIDPSIIPSGGLPVQTERKQTQSAQAADSSSGGYGIAPPYGDIQSLIEVLVSVGTPYEYKAVAMAIAASVGIGAVSTALGNLVSTFTNMVNDPTAANCEAFYDAYQQIYGWTQDSSSNPVVQKLDQLGNKLGWSSTETQDAINAVTGKASQLVDKLNNIFDTELDPYVDGSQPFSYYLEYPGWANVEHTIEEVADGLNAAITNPQENPSGVQAYEATVTDLSDLLSTVTSTMSANVIPQLKLATGVLQSLVEVFGSILKMESKQYQAADSNMPGASGG